MRDDQFARTPLTLHYAAAPHVSTPPAELLTVHLDDAAGSMYQIHRPTHGKGQHMRSLVSHGLGGPGVSMHAKECACLLEGTRRSCLVVCTGLEVLFSPRVAQMGISHRAQVQVRPTAFRQPCVQCECPHNRGQLLGLSMAPTCSWHCL